MRSPLRRSALRDMTQDNYTSPLQRKRKLKKQVSFAEHDTSNIFLISPKKNSATGSSSNSENTAVNLDGSPPPYEQIADFITNRRGLFSRVSGSADTFHDAKSSFSHSLR